MGRRIALVALAALTAAAAVGVSHSQALRRTTELARHKFSGTTVLVNVVEETGGQRRGMLFVADEHAIRTNLLVLDAAQAKALRKSLDDLIDEMEGRPRSPANQALDALFARAAESCRGRGAAEAGCARIVSGCRTMAATPSEAEACLKNVLP